MAYNPNQSYGFQAPPPQGYGPQMGGYPQSGYPTQQPGYPPQGGYPQQSGFPNQGGYPQQSGFPNQGGFPQPGMGYNTPGFGMHMPFPPSDVEGQNKFPSGGQADERFNLSERSVRQAFIRKVYSILMLQLLVTFGMVAAFMYVESVKLWTRRNPAVVYAALGVTFVVLMTLACCENVRRKAPGNFICLGIFTLAQGFLLGTVASFKSEKAVLMALGITAVICLSLTVFSFQTKIDVTGMGTYLFVCTIVLLLMGILAFFFSGLRVVYAGAGALLFSIYLVYDTQLMLGGNHKYSISPEEYIFAALNIYVDIVNIFIFILSLLGSQD